MLQEGHALQGVSATQEVRGQKAAAVTIIHRDRSALPAGFCRSGPRPARSRFGAGGQGIETRESAYMKHLILTATVVVAAFASPAWASGGGESVAHFEGRPADTLPQAVANFAEYNGKLRAILDGKVTDADMADVHQLTYTLENALKKINDEMAGLAVTLEAVHQASEKLDRAAVLKHGRAYLSVADEVVK